ncbi:phosphate ABC transporter permease PstA [bacterium]|nr:phosphate ABC transporter permease PstA [bacterium]
MERKAKSKERTLAKNGVELTAAELADFKLDYLHSQLAKDEHCFAALDTHPTTRERWLIGGTIIKDIIATFPSRFPTKAGLKSALAGSLWLIIFTALFAIPIGVSAAIYLEEYAPKNRLSRFIEVNIANLAGVPSIVYGILGLAVFVRGIHLGRSVLAGALTMSLLILPVIIIAAREAIKAVPDSIRQGAFALGATRWQTVRHHVLPVALPGILTGVILAMSRALGETAPMIMIGALSYVAFVPTGPMDDFTVLPIQIYNWVAMPQREFHLLAACGILILLIFLLLMNSVAIFVRQRAQRNIKW